MGVDFNRINNRSRPFKVHSNFQPAGDQGQAIEKISRNILQGEKAVTLKGVTGSGKTFTMAKVIEKLQMPSLVISHNKTLAAQLYREFKEFFPENAVEYFVSYYDYYQPEAYVASRDLYIEKDAQINDEIERLRLSATRSLMGRKDVLIVATVSCIYGLGSPEYYEKMRLDFLLGQSINISEVTKRLVNLQYKRNDIQLDRASFRIKGDVLDIFPAYGKEVFRIEMDWESVERIRVLHPISMEVLEELDGCTIYAARHFVMPYEEMQKAFSAISEELDQRYQELLDLDKKLEAERLKSRTEYDLEMLKEMGYCSGIENYSRLLSGRKAGERPAVLLDYFPKPFLGFIDESHVSLPQLQAMYAGDRSRKMNLVDFGFRLPSALDNRPLRKEEVEKILEQRVYVSATPGIEEIEKSAAVVEQIIRPTGLLDPELEVRSTAGQMEDIYAEVQKRIANNERCLITTLTKKMAEKLASYLQSLEIQTRYLHSEIDTLQRVEIIRDLRKGEFDVLVGINLLREGLDIPEVSLICILDADKIGFLRSATSLIQTIGRAARNVNGKVIMYADKTSSAMQEAITETERRRKVQEEYNQLHGITPQSIKKEISNIIDRKKQEAEKSGRIGLEIIESNYNITDKKQRSKLIKVLEKQMLEHAKNMEFEQAALIRDEIYKLKDIDNE